jgi:serine O-acetyltransferase
MKKILTTCRLFIYTILCIPHLLVYFMHGKRKVVRIDARRWLDLYQIPYNNTMGFIYLLSYYPEFRNLLYYRIGPVKHFLNITCPKMSTLFIVSRTIGEGLFIQHGFATVIAADSIGKNCWINQQVTIGFTSSTDCPAIGDNVTISAGAKVLGGIKIGNNSIVGANAVVVKNVPENCVVIGVPAYIIKREGVKVKEQL